MKKRILIANTMFFYVIALVMFCTYIFVSFSNSLSISPIFRLIHLICICSSIYIGSISLIKIVNKKDKKIQIMKNTFMIFFVLYLLLIVTFTLFDNNFGRSGVNILSWNSEKFNVYIKNSLNIIPFKTITDFIIKFINSDISLNTFLINIVGNIVALMPFGFFLPLLFGKKINNVKTFLIFMTIFTFGIEFLQFIFFTGSCDIDDIILNVFGSIMIYLIMKQEKVKNIVSKITLL